MMLTCRQVSAITRPMDPVFKAFEGHAYGVDAADPGRASELRFARCWDAGKRKWEVGVWAPVYIDCR
jgi:hypothetical protein